jgi:hypothetical protein
MTRVATVFVSIGDRIGRGVVLEPELPREVGDHRARKARLQCDCGVIYEATLSSLKVNNHTGRVNTRSCGCLSRDSSKQMGKSRRTHGLSKALIYHTWSTMMQRCYNPNNAKYHRYGKRGIKVCAAWHDAGVFNQDIFELLGPRPVGYTMDRIDNDGDYQPDNIRWASAKTQSANRGVQIAINFLDWAKENHPEIVNEWRLGHRL